MYYCPFLENIYRHVDTLANNSVLIYKDLFYTFLSAFLGVLFGYLLTKRLNKSHKKQQVINLQKDLLETFKKNISLIKQCIDQLENKKEIPNYLLDINSINHILFNGKQLFTNESLYKGLNRQRYQMEHINNKLTYLLNLNLYKHHNQYLQDSFVIEKTFLLQHLMMTEKETSLVLSDFEKTL